MSDKTEEPTPKRLRKALEEGNSPTSAFATQALAFVCALAVAPAAAAALVEHTTEGLRGAIKHAADATPSASFDPAVVATSIVAIAAPMFVVAGAAAAVASLVQAGGTIAFKRLAPKLERLDPIAGMKQLVSTARLVAIARAALYAGGVVWIAYGSIRSHAIDLAHVEGRAAATTILSGALSLAVAKRAAFLGLLLAIVDVVITRHSWRKKLMMSKDEVKREHKESEGDPQLKAARERVHHEVLFAATLANVKKASVVIVNPTHLACAVRYDEEGGDDAPVLVASGRGEFAARIIDAARAFGVPVLRDVPLARALIELEVDSAIPEALYEAVAEILRDAWEQADGVSQ